jgi:hypothetical protein
MTQLGSLKYTHLAYLSQPAADRVIYRTLHKQPVRSIVELGVGTAVRARRMIAVAASAQPDAVIQYTGIDFFEDRPAPRSGIALREAFRLLRQMHARVRLIPGDPLTALARFSNDLPDTDVLVIGADQDRDALSRAWMFVPRMIHADSLIFVQDSDASGNPGQFAVVTPEQIAQRTGRAVSGRRQAA